MIKFKKFVSLLVVVGFLMVLCGALYGGTQKQAADSKSVKVNINTAGVNQLVKLPRIGEKIAKRIIEFREKNGKPRVSGLVLSWSPVEHLDLHVDPLGIKASFVVDGTGHPAEICRIVIRKMGVKLDTKTGDVVGEMPLWAEKGEQFTVANTGEVFPGLYVAGMAANNVFGGPRMGPIFGGMLLSGKKIAELISQGDKGET